MSNSLKILNNSKEKNLKDTSKGGGSDKDRGGFRDTKGEAEKGCTSGIV